MTYEMDVAGLKRELPLCKVSDDLYIGAFVMFGDVELTVHCAAELLKARSRVRLPDRTGSQGDPLLYEMARQSGADKYFLARKGPKAYMSGVFEVDVKSITTMSVQKLVIDTSDAELIRASACSSLTTLFPPANPLRYGGARHPRGRHSRRQDGSPRRGATRRNMISSASLRCRCLTPTAP